VRSTGYVHFTASAALCHLRAQKLSPHRHGPGAGWTGTVRGAYARFDMKSLGKKPDGARLERIKAFDLVMLEVGAFHPAWGDIHLGPQNALEALAPLGGGPFLPVHCGTFSLAMHAWDQPAETLLELGPKKAAQLVMPRLGEPVEPAHVEGVEPWWRAAETGVREADPDTPAAPTPPKAMSWPID
jgi:hypothetical protein